MNQRLNISDLAALLAEYTGKDKKTTELFLRELVNVISDGLFDDHIAKVKGLGTFKSIQVEERESIHVNTGERIVIPAHSKFTFSPDKDLKELINKPFSSFETTELNEGVVFPDSKMSIKDDNELDEEIYEEELESDASEIEEEKSTDLPEENLTETQETDLQPESSVEQDNDEEQTLNEPQQSVPVEPEEKPVMPVKPKSTNHNKTWIMVALITTVCVFVGVFVWFYNATKKQNTPNQPVLAQQVEPSDSLSQTIEASNLPLDSALESQPLAEPDLNEASTSSKEPIKIKIVPDTRLTLIALKYYGNKVFWVYIYEYNKAIIKNPNNIQIGTELVIPDASVYGIDADNPESVAKAEAKQQELNSRF